MTQLVDLSGAGVSLGGRPILRDVDFTLEGGRVAGVAGPNGSGKTTLLRAIASLTRLDQGRGALLGADMNTNAVYTVRSSIVMIGHNPNLISELTLKENLLHAARLRGASVERIERILEIVGLGQASSHKAGEASFGTKRRVEVARALLTRPSLLLLDEALSGLDEDAKGLVDALIDRTTNEAGGVVMVSHDSTHLEGRSDNIFELAAGRLKAEA